MHTRKKTKFDLFDNVKTQSVPQAAQALVVRSYYYYYYYYYLLFIFFIFIFFLNLHANVQLVKRDIVT